MCQVPENDLTTNTETAVMHQYEISSQGHALKRDKPLDETPTITYTLHMYVVATLH